MNQDGDERRLNIVVLEPYYGGSHRGFVDTLMRHSRHRFELLWLPARKWKWRMRGSAIWFARRLQDGSCGPVDLILANDMVNVADLRALMPEPLRRCPVLCYFHENQLTYPLSPNDQRDYQYGFTNLTSCLASDEVWFNSHSHREAFLAGVDELLRKMPDHVPPGIVQEIRRRSCVRWPLVESPPESVRCERAAHDGPVVILWSHRWEYDKNPELFFRAVFRLNDQGLDFRLVLLGESFREVPPIFADAWRRLEGKILHRGYAKDRGAYWRLLAQCDVVVSTSIQENFGISVAEAILTGCRPLLPDRLSYPELVSAAQHQSCLYRTDHDFYASLRQLVIRTAPTWDPAAAIEHLQGMCGVERCKHLYDTELWRVKRLANGADGA